MRVEREGAQRVGIAPCVVLTGCMNSLKALLRFDAIAFQQGLQTGASFFQR